MFICPRRPSSLDCRRDLLANTLDWWDCRLGSSVNTLATLDYKPARLDCRLGSLASRQEKLDYTQDWWDCRLGSLVNTQVTLDCTQGS